METNVDALTFINNLIQEQDKEFEVTKKVFDQQIARTIKKLRQQVGITQTEFAEQLGVKQGRIAQLESGDRPSLRMETILTVFYHLGYDVELRIVKDGIPATTITTVESGEESDVQEAE